MVQKISNQCLQLDNRQKLVIGVWSDFLPSKDRTQVKSRVYCDLSILDEPRKKISKIRFLFKASDVVINGK